MMLNVGGKTMEINKIEMYGGKELYLLGDVHLPRGCVGKFKAVIDEIKHNPKAVAILMGDYIEGINHRDPRYHPEETYVKGNVAKPCINATLDELYNFNLSLYEIFG